MDRVKKIEELKISEGFVLLQLHMKSSLILTPEKVNKESGGPQLDYAEVLVVGHGITDMKVGDIVLAFGTAPTFDWNGGHYSIVPRMAMRYFIKPDNFNNGRSKTAETRSKLKN